MNSQTTNKKLLQQNCQKLRSQIEELEVRLRSSSLNKVIETRPERSSIKVQDYQSIDKEKIKQEYERALETLEHNYKQSKERLRTDYENRLSQLQRQHSKTTISRPPSRTNKENSLNITNISENRKE